MADDLGPAVERAARALFQDDYPDRSWDDQPPAYWARPSRDDYRRAARVALTAAGLLVTPEHDAQVAARARQDALRLAAAAVEHLYRPGLVDRASILGDLHEWAERAGRGIAPTGRPYADRTERQAEGRATPHEGPPDHD